MVVVGVAITEAVEGLPKLAEGLQTKLVAPAAESDADVPLHIEVDGGVVTIVGVGFTVIVTVLVPVQPAAFLPTTV